MFRLHERTQRRVGRASFLAFCVLPVLGVAAWTVHTRLPAYRHAVADRIGRAVGLSAAIERVRHPRPGVLACDAVSLSRTRGGPTLVTIERLEVSSRHDGQGDVWQVEGAHVAADTLGQIVRVLEDQLIGHFSAGDIVIRDLTVAPPVGHANLEPLRITDARIQPVDQTKAHGGGPQIVIQFRLPNASERSVVHVAMPSRAEPGNSSVRLAFDTKSATVPCWVLAQVLPSLGDVGSTAGLCGSGTLVLSRSEPAGDLTAELRDIDFARAFPTLATGTIDAVGSLILDQIRWRDGRLEAARGAARAGKGVIDGRLVDAAVQALYCVRPNNTADGGASPQQQNGAERIRFDELAVRFMVDSGGLTLWGECTATQRGAILAQSGRPLLVEPIYRNLPVATLVYLMVPHTRHYLPATREAQAIAGLLPLPPAETIEPVQQAAQQGPTRQK